MACEATAELQDVPSTTTPTAAVPIAGPQPAASLDALSARARAGQYRAGARIDAVEDTVTQLLAQNAALLDDPRLRQGTNAQLLDALAVWRRPARSTFLGLRVTTECNVGHDTTASRCVMCDQALFGTASWERDIETWERAVDEATEQGRRPGVLVNISGGEPLLRLGATLRLVRFAADRGAVVNLNTNGHAMTEPVALRLIGAGLAKLHVSVHGATAAVHEAVQPAAHGHARALRAIELMAAAKRRVGSDYPVLHLNYVLTRQNLDDYPAVVAWALARRRPAPRYDEGHTQSNPNRRDLCVHLLALAGERYAELQPLPRERARFQREVFLQAERLWSAWLDDQHVPAARRCSYAELIVKSYFDAAWQLPEEPAKRCHVSATQGYFLPDGGAYVCGRHADHPGEPAWPPHGNVHDTPVAALSHQGGGAAGLPSSACRVACAANTRSYNLAVERLLIQRARARMAAAP